MQNDVFVSVKDLSRYYGANCAVNHIDFQVKKGEVLGLLGPNGAGKSTTMLAMTGNLAPTEGEIIINGIDMLDCPKQAKHQIGFLPDQPPLYKDLKVDEYLRFCAQINRIPRNQLASAMDVAKQRCGLTEVAKKLIGNLSKGFQQRVGIAQAIIHSPSVVILDEPTTGLDPIQIREIRQLISDLRGDHSIILSSHILPEIQTVCDRVIILNKGKLIMDDSIAGLQAQMQSSSLETAFLKPPSMEQLQSIPHVQMVKQLDDTRFQFHYEPGKNPAQTIVELSVANQWQLTELIPGKHTLEQVFVSLTMTEPSEQEQAA